ncbi:MAG: redoxin family protein [Acidobacteriia bacterium]|nr:redoxin family protein [Terriglobia bacterium]
MNRLLPLVLALAAWPCSAQPAKAPPKAELSPQEKEELESALAEAGSSPIEFLRALEKHLAKYPDSPGRPDIERAAVRAAIQANDDPRIIAFGERVLRRQPDDLQILDAVARALLTSDAKTAAERALKYARRSEELLRQMQKGGAHGGMSAAEWQNQTDRSLSRALGFEARAGGNLGRLEEALALAQRAFETYPNADAARENARWQERLGKPEAAARALADAFAIPDAKTTDADRARDRARMGDLYRRAKGTDAGLGDLLLEAYDRNLALVRAREMRMRQSDPNALLTNPMEFTLGGLDGEKLNMASLKGKILVLDVWATWCVPCRAQHPLYQRVKQRFRDNADVVFLSIDTDEDRSLVKPFLEAEKWPDKVYFEDGLTRALAITSIPTTIVIDRRGQVVSRMNGYVPERFVDMLSERVRDALR